MRVRIHRGAREIGGSCVELESAGQRIVLDLGRPLNAAIDEDIPLPAIADLSEGGQSLLGVVVSHPHPDHYGLVSGAHASVPIYIGEAAQRLLSEAAFFTPAGVALTPASHLQDRISFELGPFCITPLLIDHSAFDAYTLIVDADGRRLMYSGDVRAHGRKAKLFERLLDDPPADVNALLLEGTHVRDTDIQAPPGMAERDVEAQCAALFAETGGVVLACYSPQNIDRLVTLYRAARHADRDMILDLYAAAVTRATGRFETIPQANWDGVRVFVPRSQRLRVRNTRAFERIEWVKPHRVFAEQLADRAGELVITFRASIADELERAGCLDAAAAVWSMWPGYLDAPAGQRLQRWLDKRGIPLTVSHSCGHASVADLQRLASAVGPDQLVPIHTAAPQRFADLFDRVTRHPDGEWWTV